MFKTRLNEIIREKELTVKELANAANISEYLIKRFLNGQSVPRFIHLIKLANYFNISIDYLVGNSNNRNIKKKW